MMLGVKRWVWLVVLVLLLAIPLALLLSRVSGGLVRDAVAVPMLYLAWIGRLYLRTVPQALFWGALLLFGLVVAITNVLVAVGDLRGRRDGRRGERALGYVGTGPVKQLASQVRFAARSAYFRRRLAQRLGRLILRSLDYGERYRRAQVERGLDALDAPPNVRAFLREGEDLIAPSRPVGLVARLRHRLWGGQGEGAPNPDLEQVIEFLENRLEVS
jgi:hypothetical protein